MCSTCFRNLMMSLNEKEAAEFLPHIVSDNDFLVCSAQTCSWSRQHTTNSSQKVGRFCFVNNGFNKLIQKDERVYFKASKVEGINNAHLVVTLKQEFLGFGSIRYYIEFRDM